MSVRRVIHTAQALVDEVAHVPGLPARGENVMASAVTRYAASAVNTLLAAARSGATCVHAGSVGTGPNADLVREALAAAGVAVSSPPILGADTGICFVMVEPSAERTFVTTLGAERQVSLASFATSAPVPGDLVCVSGYSLVGQTRDPLLAFLESLPPGVDVVLDPGAAFAGLPAPVRERMLAVTRVWTSNAAEAAELAGWPRAGGAADAPGRAGTPDPMDTAGALAERLGGAVVVVRDGPRGCVVRTGAHAAAVPGYPQAPVDTNGAGDCHTGILVAGRIAGLGWVDAARRANAGAALKVTRHGPSAAPTAAEIDAFLAALPSR